MNGILNHIDISVFIIVFVVAFALLNSFTKIRRAFRKKKTSRGFYEEKPFALRLVKDLKGEPESSYVNRKYLLTKAELSAFRQLHDGLSGAAHIAPKVRIADILRVERTNNPKIDGPAFSRISQKHVDFVVMSFTGTILFALEIDDRSHERDDRKARDAFVNSAFEKAKVPLFRAKPGKLDKCNDLQAFIQRLKSKPDSALPA